jgi:hypothetical protein
MICYLSDQIGSVVFCHLLVVVVLNWLPSIWYINCDHHCTLACCFSVGYFLPRGYGFKTYLEAWTKENQDNIVSLICFLNRKCATQANSNSTLTHISLQYMLITNLQAFGIHNFISYLIRYTSQPHNVQAWTHPFHACNTTQQIIWNKAGDTNCCYPNNNRSSETKLQRNRRPDHRDKGVHKCRFQRIRDKHATWIHKSICSN